MGRRVGLFRFHIQAGIGRMEVERENGGQTAFQKPAVAPFTNFINLPRLFLPFLAQTTWILSNKFLGNASVGLYL